MKAHPSIERNLLLARCSTFLNSFERLQPAVVSRRTWVRESRRAVAHKVPTLHGYAILVEAVERLLVRLLDRQEAFLAERLWVSPVSLRVALRGAAIDGIPILNRVPTLLADLVVHGPQVDSVLVEQMMRVRRLVNCNFFGLLLFVAGLHIFLNLGSEGLVIDSGSLRRRLVARGAAQMEQGLVVLEKSSGLIFGRQREKVILFVDAWNDSDLRHVNNLVIRFQSLPHFRAVLVQLLEPRLLNQSFDPPFALVELGVGFTGISWLLALTGIRLIIIIIISIIKNTSVHTFDYILVIQFTSRSDRCRLTFLINIIDLDRKSVV